MSLHRSLAVCCIGLSTLAFAADPAAKKPAAKSSAKSSADKPKLDLGTLNLGEIPKGEGMQKASATGDKPLGTASTVRPEEASYSVTKVQFAKTFNRSGSMQVAVSPMTSITLSGKPPTTEKFSSAVRVKCPQKVSAPIEMAILDTRGDTAMSADGQVIYKGATGDEVDYVVEWDPTPWRAGGKFQFLVRVAGQPMGTWPLMVTEKP